MREQLTDALLDGVDVPKPLVDIAYKFREETRTIDYVTLDAEKARQGSRAGRGQTAGVLRAEQARVPRAGISQTSLLLLTTDEVKKLVPVSDDEVRAEYERDKERFNDPEKRRILQLSFPDIEAAEKAAIAIAKAKSFEEGAKALGIQESDFDLGLVARSDLIDKALAEAAFGLEKGKTSIPVAGRFTTAAAARHRD